MVDWRELVAPSPALPHIKGESEFLNPNLTKIILSAKIIFTI
jgi:hypothetical protein